MPSAVSRWCKTSRLWSATRRSAKRCASSAIQRRASLRRGPQEGFDDRHPATISKRQVNALLDFQFIDEHNNLIFIGPPGVRARPS